MVNLYLKPLKSKLEQQQLGRSVFEISTSGQPDNVETTSKDDDGGCRMTAKAVLLCRPNSHPFQERTLILDQPVKVGRSVARARTAAHNGIFDCKVLSRNHALLWYDNGKFYLQDTKSSNGTFVNNQRLSKGSEESTPREVCSGDIVQFGVDVMENSRKGKVTHGCIVATLKLYLPDGKEAKASPSTVMLPSCPSTIATQDLYALAECLQEALHREQMLENKLSTLQKLVNSTEEASESSWKALIDEDRLLTRLEMLENQVQTSSKNINDETIRQEVVRLQEDKDHYQVSAKETLRKAYQEKLEAMRKLQDVERQLNNSENECKNLQQVYETTQKELLELAERYNARLKEIQDLTEKLQEAEVKDKLSEKGDHDVKNSFNEDNDVSNDQLSLTKVMLGDIDNSSVDGEESPTEIKFPILRATQENHYYSKEEVEDLSSQIKESEKELIEYKAKVTDLTKLLDKAQVEAVKSVNGVAQLEVQLREAKTQAENGSVRIKQLQDQIEKLEDDLQGLQETKENKDARLTIIYKSEVEPSTPTVTLPMPPRSSSPRPASPKPESVSVTTNGEVVHQNGRETTHSLALKVEIDKLKELLAETRENKLQAEREVLRFKAELEDARNNVKKVADDANILRQQLQSVEMQAEEKSDVVMKLQDQLKRAELALMDVQQQIAALKEHINQDQQRLRLKHDEVDLVRQQLVEAQHGYKQAHNESEQLRNKVDTLNRQLERQTALNLESAALEEQSRLVSEECKSLKMTIQNLEAGLRQVKNEKARLLEEHKRAQARPRSTEGFSQAGAQEIELLQEEFEASQRKLQDACREIVNLKQTCEAYHEERTRLRREIDAPGQGSQIPNFFMIPLLVIIIGILVVFYPKLALITATVDPALPPS